MKPLACHLRHVAALCVLAACAWAADAVAPAGRLDLVALRTLRQEAAHRPRRMIFNNDADDMILAKEATPEALLVQRTAALAGSQVDCIFYGGAVCFGYARYNSRVWEPFLSTADVFRDNSLPAFIAKGLDPIQIVTDFCHANGMEMFWDMRVNDTHDAGTDAAGNAMRSRFKGDHPDYLVGTPDKPPPYGTWSSVDYAVPQVRDLAYRFIEEACQTYDIEGVGLDFLRHACFFKSVAWGGKASPQELEMMTDLLRRIRQMTEREGLRRGRPILLAIRVPDSLEYCRGIGLDLETWLSEGLVDLLAGTCYYQLNPWEYLVELGHRYGVPVYPSLSDPRVEGETRFKRSSLESYRARAMQAWVAGADGLYLFNYFDPTARLWREGGELKTLRGKDKLYFLSPRNGAPNTYLADGRQYQRVPIITPKNPCALASDKPVEVELAIGDDLAEAEQAGLKPTVTCHLRTLGGTAPSAALNGQTLEAPTATADWLDFPVPPTLLKVGANRLRISMPPPTPTGGAERWDIVYDGTALPASPWQKDGFYTKEGLVTEVQKGALLIADRSTENGAYAYFFCPCAIRPTHETVIEVRLKTISGTSNLMIETGSADERIVFSPDRVSTYRSGLSYSMNTADDFHTYRVVLSGNSYAVYADGKLCLDGKGAMTYPAHNGRSGVFFGASSSTTTGEALWASLKIRTHVVSLLDVAVSIRYGGH
jgi:hypothetical protein